MADTPKKTKIAILGGGAGALASAFGLTKVPGWRDKYEITVYQLGWRLGGKGASGRNAAAWDRIEEHGVHVWAGFYENAFGIMNECYHSLGRPPGSPLAEIDEAFKPQDLVTLEEYIGGRWMHWNLRLPRNKKKPGVGGSVRTPWQCVRMAIASMRKTLDRSPYAATQSHTLHSSESLTLPRWLDRVMVKTSWALLPPSKQVASPRNMLQGAEILVRELRAHPDRHRESTYQGIVWFLGSFRESLWNSLEHEVGSNHEARRLWILLDLVSTHVRGILRDGVLVKGFQAIDDQEWKAWLFRHGATDLTLDSALVRTAYDYIFAYEKGDVRRPAVSAGVSVRGLLRLFFTYKGAFFYHLQAGMGDVVFAPLYHVLRQRGVKFEFFRRVENLGLAGDGNSITTIRMTRQCRLKEPEYCPLIEVKGLPCWPSKPNYDQIENGAELEETLKLLDTDLESYWSSYGGGMVETLEVGKDFDRVILGISLGALRHVAAELVASRPDWARMVQEVKTVQTQALQLWFRPDAAGLGWPFPPSVSGGYAPPLSDWAEMTHLIPRESWPVDQEPRYLALLCGPLDEPAPIPPPTQSDFPRLERRRVMQNALTWLRLFAGHLWPNFDPENSGDLDWELLADPTGNTGLGRFYVQHFSTNINPSDRYVISVPGSSRHRLASGRSGFENLYLAGDWVDNPINAGCIEAAVMGGLLAARALSNHPLEVAGEEHWHT